MAQRCQRGWLPAGVLEDPHPRGAVGSSALYVAKDRPGQVKRHGRLEMVREAGWTYLGQLVVDDTLTGVMLDGSHTMAVRVSSPEVTESEHTADGIDALAEDIVSTLEKRGGEYSSQTELENWLRADRVTFNDRDTAPALERLELPDRIERPAAVRGKPRPGRLSSVAILNEEEK
jgi:hypothetical protein